KRASSELKETFEREMQTIERETESLKIDTHNYTNEIYNYDSYYDSGHHTPELEESTAHVPSTVSASAPQGAESPANTIAHGSEEASTTNGASHVENTVAQNGTAHPASSPEGTVVKS